jgi:photosystem II stability/assembly factor-like uncharacterized protein
MSNVLHVATRKGLITFRRNGADWAASAPAFIGQPVSAVLTDARDGALYAALRLGHFGVKLHRSDDHGKSWSEIAAPAFPAVENPDEKTPAIDMIWTLAPSGKDELGVLWAGTIPGGLFKSPDRGATWTLNDSLWNKPERAEWAGGGYDQPGIHSVLVDPRDSKSITVGVSTGGVWRSSDAGRSWRLTGQGLRAEYMPPAQAFDLAWQDVHRLSACAAAPDIVWCQHHNGMFRSTDGGETFSEIKEVKPSVFGFAVGAHPSDPDTAWFVPAIKDELRIPVDGKLVVTKTTDGGKSFAAHADGLPGLSYDLIYRHSLDVSEDGARLAIGSTTGNLWVSDDAGRRWSHIHGHLSPIAAVAFG